MCPMNQGPQCAEPQSFTRWALVHTQIPPEHPKRPRDSPGRKRGGHVKATDEETVLGIRRVGENY